MEEIVRLSFSNFPFEETSSPTAKSSPPRSDPLFEFAAAGGGGGGAGDVIFCGKIIRQDQDELNEYEKRDYFANIRSQSLRKNDRSSGRFSGDLDYHAQSQRVMSTTSLTSSKSRRRVFMFWPVKFKPEMELGDIKRRQRAARRAAPSETRARANELEIVQPSLRGRSYLVNVLARSFSCM